MRRQTRRILAAAEVAGRIETLQRVLREAEEVRADAVALVGDLVGPEGDRAETYRRLFRVLGGANLPAFYVPGGGDAPVGVFLREAYNMEIVYPFLRAVHGTVAFAPGFLGVAGMGGAIVDEPSTEREEVERLRYPAWEAEYRLKVLDALKDYPTILLFATPPAHKTLGAEGSATLAELVKTHTPRAVVCGGREPRQARLGTSLLVAPGRLADGHYAVVDLAEDAADLRRLG